MISQKMPELAIQVGQKESILIKTWKIFQPLYIIKLFTAHSINLGAICSDPPCCLECNAAATHPPSPKFNGGETESNFHCLIIVLESRPYLCLVVRRRINFSCRLLEGWIWGTGDRATSLQIRYAKLPPLCHPPPPPKLHAFIWKTDPFSLYFPSALGLGWLRLLGIENILFL